MVERNTTAAPAKQPAASRSRTVYDLLGADGQEGQLRAMVQLALMHAGDPDEAEQASQDYLTQLRSAGVSTESLDAFGVQLREHPCRRGWHDRLLEQLAQVTAARRRIWLALGSLNGAAEDEPPLEGVSLRRMDAILDLADFPASVQDLQTAFAAFATDIADAKVSTKAEVGLFLGAVLAGGAAGYTGHLLSGGKAGAAGIGYLRERLAKVDPEARVLAELVLAASAAALDDDGVPDVKELRHGLCEDIRQASLRQSQIRERSGLLNKPLSKRISMMHDAADSLKELQLDLSERDDEGTDPDMDRDAPVPDVEDMALPLAIWILEHFGKNVVLQDPSGKRRSVWLKNDYRVISQLPPAGHRTNRVHLRVDLFPTVTNERATR